MYPVCTHRLLGPGLLESAYEQCLCHELVIREIPFRRQVPLPIVCKDVRIDCGYRAATQWGLLVNFNVLSLRLGLRRLTPDSPPH